MGIVAADKINALKNHAEIEFFNHDILLNTDFFVDVKLYMEREDATPLHIKFNGLKSS